MLLLVMRIMLAVSTRGSRTGSARSVIGNRGRDSPAEREQSTDLLTQERHRAEARPRCKQ